MNFSSGSESKDRIGRSDLLRKRGPRRRGGICEGAEYAKDLIIR